MHALQWLLASLIVCAFLGQPSAAKAQAGEKAAEGESVESSEKEIQQHTQMRCSADISYLWEHRVEPKLDKDEKGKKKSKAPEKTQEHYETVFQTGPTEKEARDKLAGQLEAHKSRAFEACQTKHSNMANCVAGGIRKNSSEYRLLDFNARRTILKALEEDCRVRSGRCLSTSASEISCSEIVEPAAVKQEKPADSAKEE